MSIQMIQDRLLHYKCLSKVEEENAIKEITQEIALMSLSNHHFFKVAEFHGGTALRILHGLQRFSEDLDFALLAPNKLFQLKPFLDKMASDFLLYGYQIEVQDKPRDSSNIKKAFLKDDSIGKILTLKYPDNTKRQKSIKIKLEVDINPPQAASYEIKYLDFPVVFNVLAKDLSSSFAGKIHALLCRKYLKGRDWYDFIWYTSNNVAINYAFLENALNQQGPWMEQNIKINSDWVFAQLQLKIESINWEEARMDVERFIKLIELKGLEHWNVDFFKSRLDKLR